MIYNLIFNKINHPFLDIILVSQSKPSYNPSPVRAQHP